MAREPPEDLVLLQGLYYHSATGEAAPAAVLSPGSTRLIRIHSPFSLSLEEAPLEDNDYVALSYHWEKDFSLCQVTINDCEYLIRSYLWEMLYTIYHIHGECCVWTDMLCINQCSEAEKGEQIHLMGDIYGRARRVYAWLGSATLDTDNIFDVLHEFARQIREWRDPLTGSCLEPELYRGLLGQIYEDTIGELPAIDASCDRYMSPETELLAPIYTRKYWTRLWIVQELILAKEVMVCCGSKSIDLGSIYGLGLGYGSWSQAFERGAYTQPHESTRGWRIMQCICDHRRIREDVVNRILIQSSTVDIPLDEVVIMYAKEQECKEHKDKIFAVRELVRQWRNGLDPTAYEQSDGAALFRDAIDLYFHGQPQHLRLWTPMWYLWRTMDLGTFDDFKDVAKAYFSPHAVQNMKVEALPASRPCRCKCIPAHARIEACRSAPEAMPAHLISQIEALDLHGSMCDILTNDL